MLILWDEDDEELSLEYLDNASAGHTHGIMYIGGLVVEISAAEVKNKDLSAVMALVDLKLEKVGHRNVFPRKMNMSIKLRMRRDAVDD
ncbi:MAG: hypothetical protein M1827_001158 [Pycnora praestabilis]|nr:MAG: hypothetical protein M1827_001158 [Pycnora praestabilis]